MSRPHDPTDCVHARWLCDQRYADLQALMADLERLQCRCERSTWGRTKSFFGSLKKRALSLRSRRKSQEVPELDAGRDAEWPSEDDPAPSTGELPALSKPAELAPDQTFIPELATSYLFASYSNRQSDATSRTDIYPSASTSYTHSFGFNQAGFNVNPGMASFSSMAGQLQAHAQGPQFYELAAQVPNPSLHAAAWYSGPAIGSFPLVSPVTPSTVSASGNRSFVSPQGSVSSASSLPWSRSLSLVSPGSSFSSVSSSMLTNAITVTAPGAPIFASHTTSSPTEMGEDVDDIAPWHQPPSRAHQGSWDSTTTAVDVAELPDSSPGSRPKPAQWLQDSSSGGPSELEAFGSFPKPTMPTLHQHFSHIQSAMPLELATEANVQRNVNQGWPTPQMEMPQNKLPVAADESWPFFQPQPAPVRPGPRPLISHARQHSYDSTASTVLDVVSDDDQDADALELTNHHPPNPPTAAVEELPSQQRAAPAKASPVKRQKAPPEMLCCLSCEFFPAPGPGQRRKMEKHKQTDGHRRKTGQDSGAELKRFSCWLCAKIYNRQDNLFQHIRTSHGVQRNQKKVMWRDMAPSIRLAF